MVSYSVGLLGEMLSDLFYYTLKSMMPPLNGALRVRSAQVVLHLRSTEREFVHNAMLYVYTGARFLSGPGKCALNRIRDNGRVSFSTDGDVGERRRRRLLESFSISPTWRCTLSVSLAIFL